MENIYNSWIHFNKMQRKRFKGPLANLCLDKIEDATKQWQNLPYPSGEDWKYVKFEQLPTANLAAPSAKGKNRQVADQDFYTIEIKDFSSITEIKGSHTINGLSISTHLEELEKKNSPLHELFREKPSDNPFAQSALSFTGLGLVLRVDKEAVLSKPVKIIFDFNNKNQKDVIAVFNLVFDCQARSQSRFFVEYRGVDLVGLANIRIDAFLGENTQSHFYFKEEGGPQSHFSFNFKAQQKRNSSLKCFDLTLPGKWTRHDLQMDLVEPGAQVDLRGSYLNYRDFFSDHHTSINHWVERTFSQEDYRGVLADQARAVFNGRIYIAPHASQSNSQQLNKNLVLSKKAEVNTKPQLQIYNDDVKASHGATIGQIDKEQLFYLQTRGYPEKEALKALAKAFIFGLFENESKKVLEFYGPSLLTVLTDMKES